MDPIGLVVDTEEFIRRMKLREFFQDVSSEPSETTKEIEQSTERSVVEQLKESSNWTPPEGHCPELDRYVQAVRECVNARLISLTHKVVQNVTQAQRNAIRALKTNHNISTLRTLISHRGSYRLPKLHKANPPGHPIVSGNRTLWENLSGYVEGILKPIVQGTASFCRDTTDFLQKLSTHGPVEPGTVLVTMDASAFYTSIPHDDSITATASELNTNNCQFLDAILQRIHFIHDHNIFTNNNQFFTQTHGTAMGTTFAPQICSDEEEHDGHLKVLKDALERDMMLDSSIASSDVLQRKTDNIDHDTIQPFHGNLRRTCQIIDIDTTIAR
eukprot:g27838.t1